MRLLATFLLFALLVPGCAAMRAAQARSKSLEASLENHSYEQTPDAVLSVARQLLVEKGFVPRDVGQNVIETDTSSESKYGDRGATSATWKYVVSALALPSGTRVMVVKKTQAGSSGVLGSSTSTTAQRDYELELALLRVVAPPSAAKVDANVKTAVDEATRH
jgi:hypothetical protein